MTRGGGAHSKGLLPTRPGVSLCQPWTRYTDVYLVLSGAHAAGQNRSRGTQMPPGYGARELSLRPFVLAHLLRARHQQLLHCPPYRYLPPSGPHRWRRVAIGGGVQLQRCPSSHLRPPETRGPCYRCSALSQHLQCARGGMAARASHHAPHTSQYARTSFPRDLYSRSHDHRGGHTAAHAI